MVDEINDRILTPIDRVLQHSGFLDIIYSALEHCEVNPLQVLYKYLDYIAVIGKTKEINANCNLEHPIIHRRLLWIRIFLKVMDLPEYSEVYQGWEQGFEERLAQEFERIKEYNRELVG